MRKEKEKHMPDHQPGAKVEEGRNKPQRVESAREKAVLCARHAAHFKALDLVLLDVRESSSFSDFFVICSGRSSRQVQGVADNLEASLGEAGIRPLGVEGRREGHWVLMDYGDVIIHIFYEPVRYFYDLESLWSDAVRVHWEENTEVTHPNAG